MNQPQYNQNQQQQERIFCGNGKYFQFPNGGHKYNLSICLDDIPQQYIRQGNNGKKYLNLEMFPNRNGADQYGKTDFIQVDTWQPPQGCQQQAPQMQQPMQNEPLYTQQPGPAVQQAPQQGYNNNGVTF